MSHILVTPDNLYVRGRHFVSSYVISKGMKNKTKPSWTFCFAVDYVDKATKWTPCYLRYLKYRVNFKPCFCHHATTDYLHTLCLVWSIVRQYNLIKLG